MQPVCSAFVHGSMLEARVSADPTKTGSSNRPSVRPETDMILKRQAFSGCYVFAFVRFNQFLLATAEAASLC